MSFGKLKAWVLSILILGNCTLHGIFTHWKKYLCKCALSGFWHSIFALTYWSTVFQCIFPGQSHATNMPNGNQPIRIFPEYWPSEEAGHGLWPGTEWNHDFSSQKTWNKPSQNVWVWCLLLSGRFYGKVTFILSTRERDPYTKWNQPLNVLGM